MSNIDTKRLIVPIVVALLVLFIAFFFTPTKSDEFCKSIQEKGYIPYPTSKEDIAKARECRP